MTRKKYLLKCADTLASAFVDQPQFIELLPRRSKTHFRKLKAFFYLLAKYCDPFRGVVANERFDGVMLFLPPAAGKIRLAPLLRAGALSALIQIGPTFARNILRLLKQGAGMESRVVREPHIKPLMFGVKPEMRGQGIGTRIIKLFWDRVEPLNLPIYIETRSPMGKEIYEYFGADVEEIINEATNTYGLMYYPDKEKAHREELKRRYQEKYE